MKWRWPIILTCISLIMALLWQQLFQQPARIVVLHGFVAAILHAFFFLLLSVVTFFCRQKIIAPILFALYVAKWLFFYLLIFASMKLWGDIITLKIIRGYIAHPWAFLQSLPVATWQVLALLGAPFALGFVITFLQRNKIADDFFSTGAHLLAQPNWLMVIVLLLAFSPAQLLRDKRHAHLHGEPLLVFLFDRMWGWHDNPFFSLQKNQAGKADVLERLRYKAMKPSGNGKNVILIVCDALRADHLSVYGYGRPTSPFLQELLEQKRALKVDHCISAGASTNIGIPSLLLSRPWSGCSPYGFNLLGLLRDAGYQTNVLISGAHTQWYNLASFYQRDCDFYWEGTQSKKYYQKDDRVLLEGLAQVPLQKNKPQFFYFHVQCPHETAYLRDSFTHYRPFKRSITTHFVNSTMAVNEYDNKVTQADATLRDIFRALDTKGLLQNALVVITADHGQGLGEHGIMGHVDWLYEPQVAVPLIIVDDSLQLYGNTTYARQIDVPATVVARLGCPIPATWQGKSLLQQNTNAPAFLETGHNDLETKRRRYALVFWKDNARYKYIFSKNFQQEELYDLTHDNAERNNIQDAALKTHARKIVAENSAQYEF